MAKYRQLYTEFWSDSFVLELTPEEKYFYLYLISNSKTTQCGIYEISKKIIESESGYNRETVEKLIKRFCDYEKILYCETTKELMVINWIKYNIPNNINAIKCVNKELGKVKNRAFLKILFLKCQAAGLDVEKIFGNIVIEEYENNNHENRSLEKVDKLPITFTLENSSEDFLIQTENNHNELINNSVEVKDIQKLNEFRMNIPLNGGLKDPYKGVPSNREEVISKKQNIINKEEEVTRPKNNSTADYEELQNIIKIFEKNIHAITPLEYEKISSFTKHVSSEIIIMAIEEAVIYNAKTIKYIAEILNSWISHGIKTANEVRAYQEKWANKKKINLTQNPRKGGFCDFQQRTYDFDALEKKLLGHVDNEDLE